MATLEGQQQNQSYKDLLQVSNSNTGIDATLRAVSDGEATASLLFLSTAAVNITGAGTLQYGGVAITSTAAELNLLDGITPGTASASKALIVDSNKDLTLGTGDFTATNITGTLQTAGQSNITSLGTLTTLTVDDITINANAITSEGASSLTIVPTTGQKLILDGHWGFDGVAFTAETDNNTTFTAFTGKNITIESTTFDNNVVTATSFVGALTGQASTVGTITGLAPDTATTQASQPNITSVGTLSSLGVGAITSTGKLDITLTSEQLRINYDATNYLKIDVLDDGHTTFETVDPDGAEADINFAPDGNVGIKTAAPAVALDVTGAITASGNVKSNASNVFEGDNSGRLVLRKSGFAVQPGATPGTNINVNVNQATRDFNQPTMTDATNLAASGSSGSFSLSSTPNTLILDISEVVLFVLNIAYFIQDLNSSGTTVYWLDAQIVSGNIQLTPRITGSQSASNWTDIMDAGDYFGFTITYVTST